MDLDVFTEARGSSRITQNCQSFPAGGRIDADDLLITAQLRHGNTNYNGVNIEPGLTIQGLFPDRKMSRPSRRYFGCWRKSRQIVVPRKTRYPWFNGRTVWEV